MEFKYFAIASTLFAFLTTVAADVVIPNGDIPFTLQSVFVLLSGLIAGANVGITSQLIYLMFGAFFPVFAGSDYGFSILADPTAGYLFAFPVAGFIAGLLGHNQNFWKIILAVVLAQTSLYISGVLVLKINSDMNWQDTIYKGFTSLALVGYTKALLTGILYSLYLNFRKKQKA